MIRQTYSLLILFIISFSLCSAKTSFHKNFKDNGLLLSGNASKNLAQDVAKQLNIPLGKAEVKRFNDGEISIQINENVRNKHVFLIQSTCPTQKQSINDNLMELILMVRALKRASIKSITAIMPYYGYARQDRKSKPRVPISASDVAMLLENAGVDRVVSIDLHCGQIQGFFQQTPVDNLYASTTIVPYFAQKDLENIVVVSPDAGGVERAHRFLRYLENRGIKGQMAIIVKQRKGAGVVDRMDLIGNVEGSNAIIVDDLCDTAGTLVKAAELLKENGAKHVYTAVTHPVFSGPALKRISNSVIEELITTDTIPLKPNTPDKIKQLSIAPLLSETIKRIYEGRSVSDLF